MSSIVSVLEDFDARDDKKSPMKKMSWRDLFAFTRKADGPVLFPALFFALICGTAKPTPPIFIGKVFRQMGNFQAGLISSDQLLATARTWALALTFLGVGLGVSAMTFFALWILFGENQARNVRVKLFDGILKKRLNWFDLRSDGIGSLLTRIHTQTRELQTGTSQVIAFIVEDTATVVSGLTIAFISSWKLTLVVLACIPLIVLAVRLVSRGLNDAIEEQKSGLGKASKLAFTAISAIDTVKTCNCEEHEVAQYTDAINYQTKPYLRQARINAYQMGFGKFGTPSMFAITFWVALTLVRKGLSSAQVVTSIYSCLMAAESAEALFPQWLILAKAISAGATLKEILDDVVSSRMDKGSTEGKFVPPSCRGEIQFSHVSFAYPSNPTQLVLKDVNFEFPAGTTTFVIGKSGSGKSTLSNLLVKFYESLGGDVSIDGISINAIDTEWIRKNITLVQQQSTLFNETLFRNIALGRAEPDRVTLEDVKMASELAILQETINELPVGLNTKVGSTGNSMSGGQRQRVAIARARLRDTPILILDEATSALDLESRSLVMEAIREWRKNKTTIIVTHELSQILPNDYVYVLENGTVVQEGPRDSIYETGAFSGFLSKSEEHPDNPFRDPKEDESRPEVSESWYDSRRNSVESEEFVPEFGLNFWANKAGLSSLLGANTLQSGMGRNRLSMGVGMNLSYANALREQSVWEAVTKDSARAQQHPRSFYLDSKSAFNQPSGNAIHELSEEQAETGLELVEIWGRNTQRKRTLNETQMRRSYPKPPQISRTDLPESKRQRGIFQRRRSINKTAAKDENDVAGLKEILSSVPRTLGAAGRFKGIVGLFFDVVSAACTPAFAYSFSRLLSTFNETDRSRQYAGGIQWGLITMAIAATDGISTFMFRYLLEDVASIWVTNLRTQAFRSIIYQPKSWFANERFSPEKLTECLDRNAEEMRNIFGRFLGVILYAAVLMSIAIIWALAVSWKLTLVGLAAGPVMYLLSHFFEASSSKWETRLNTAGQSSSTVFSETFQNIRVVRAFTLERDFQTKHQAAVSSIHRVGTRRALWTGFFFGLNDCSIQLVTALIVYYGCVLAASREHSVPDIISVMILLLFSTSAAVNATSLIPQIGQARATAKSMLFLASLPKDASHEAQGTRKIKSPFPIRLHNLNFSYPPPREGDAPVQILRNVSLTFEAGTSTALVGLSGCGKSTIVSLLLGLYPPSPDPAPDPSSSPSSLSSSRNNTLPPPPHAPLTFAHHPISTLHTPSLRALTALVPQHPTLFPASVAANITYGLPALSRFASEANITRATRLAGIHDFIVSLPMGYETLVGDSAGGGGGGGGGGGMSLSGGQAQRIAIARALVRRPKLLVLDEATSALDAEGAGRVRDVVKRLVEEGRVERDRGDGGTAVVVVTHAVEMMRGVDRVVVLEVGRVVECGALGELVGRGGRLGRLIRGGEMDA